MQLQRLNMDNSWHYATRDQSILIDPWLEGVEVDYFPWFNTQWHRTPPLSYAQIPAFDAVLITQKYPDHFHEKTLRALQPTHLFAPKSIHKALHALLPNATIQSFGAEDTQLDWGHWSIHWMHTARRIDPIYDAVLIDDGVRSLFIATHGFQLSHTDVARLNTVSPIHVLMSPFNRYRLPSLLGGLVSPGLDGLKTLVEQTNPAVVLRTHDEDKHHKGLVSKLATIERFTGDMLSRHPWLSDRYSPMTDYSPVTY